MDELVVPTARNTTQDNTDLIDKGEDHGRLAAMDVNQAYMKGKSSGKGYNVCGYKGKDTGKDPGKGFDGKGRRKGVEAKAEEASRWRHFG